MKISFFLAIGLVSAAPLADVAIKGSKILEFFGYPSKKHEVASFLDLESNACLKTSCRTGRLLAFSPVEQIVDYFNEPALSDMPLNAKVYKSIKYPKGTITFIEVLNWFINYEKGFIMKSYSKMNFFAPAANEEDGDQEDVDDDEEYSDTEPETPDAEDDFNEVGSGSEHSSSIDSDSEHSSSSNADSQSSSSNDSYNSEYFDSEDFNSDFFDVKAFGHEDYQLIEWINEKLGNGSFKLTAFAAKFAKLLIKCRFRIALSSKSYQSALEMLNFHSFNDEKLIHSASGYDFLRFIAEQDSGVDKVIEDNFMFYGSEILLLSGLPENLIKRIISKKTGNLLHGFAFGKASISSMEAEEFFKRNTEIFETLPESIHKWTLQLLNIIRFFPHGPEKDERTFAILNAHFNEFEASADTSIGSILVFATINEDEPHIFNKVIKCCSHSSDYAYDSTPTPKWRCFEQLNVDFLESYFGFRKEIYLDLLASGMDEFDAQILAHLNNIDYGAIRDWNNFLMVLDIVRSGKFDCFLWKEIFIAFRKFDKLTSWIYDAIYFMINEPAICADLILDVLDRSGVDMLPDFQIPLERIKQFLACSNGLIRIFKHLKNFEIFSGSSFGQLLNSDFYFPLMMQHESREILIGKYSILSVSEVFDGLDYKNLRRGFEFLGVFIENDFEFRFKLHPGLVVCPATHFQSETRFHGMLARMACYESEENIYNGIIAPRMKLRALLFEENPRMMLEMASKAILERFKPRIKATDIEAVREKNLLNDVIIDKLNSLFG